MDEDSIIILNDESGQEVHFEFLDLIEMDAEEYIVLLPEGQDEDDAGKVLILRVETVDDESETYVSVEDEIVLGKVFEIFREKYEDEFDFVDE